MARSREKYEGSERKLLLAFDVGTTYSGISYSILDPGKEPEIQGVHKFPGQEMAGGNAKIPSVMYYSKDGQVRTAGAETERDGMDIIAEEEDLVKTEWFKLHLRPRTTDFMPGNASIPPLPLGKTVVEVLSDFLKYLNDCAKQYIQQVHPGIGTTIWNGPEIHYILSHPNGWEGTQKALMKQAAEKAELIRPNGRNQLTFITEGEASLNRSIGRGLMSESIQNGDGVTIVDAGGGTLDISAYAYRPQSKNFEEIAESQCHFKGSIFVTEAAVEYLEKLLKGSKFVKDIPTMKQYFDKTTKCSFRDPNDPHFIKFGSVGDKDAKLKITRGNLRLDGKIIASFFEPSIKSMIDGVLSQRQIAHKKISSVFLVGGFAASDYVFSRLKEGLEPHGLRLYRPDTQINKVVADGAISGVLDKPVGARVSRFYSGIICATPYRPVNPEHAARAGQCFAMFNGGLALPNSFSVILPRNTQVSEAEEFRSTYTKRSMNPFTLNSMESEIMCYRGDLPLQKLQWPDNDSENYHRLCTVRADIRNIPVAHRFGPKGPFYEVMIDIVLLFGLTDLKAQIAWVEGWEEKRFVKIPQSIKRAALTKLFYRGPAEIVYDSEV